MSVTLRPYPEYKDSGVSWLRDIPAHWSSVSVKRHFSIQLGKMLQGTQAKADERPVNYLKAQHVQWFAVRTSELPTMWASPEGVVKFGVQPGDLLVCEGGEGGRCGIVKQLPDQCIIQNALHRVRPIGSSRAQYLQYVMSTVAATGWFAAINNKATIAHFTHEKFGALVIPVPPSHEQDAIVAFLTHADRLINRLIRAKRQLIELLNEQKQVIIHQAVIRGLDLNVRLKPSDIDWLGDVPEHWEVTRCGQLFREVVDTGHPNCELLSIDRFRGVIRQAETGRKERASEDRSSYKRVRCGELAYNLMNAFMGSIGVSQLDGILSPAYAVARPKRIINPKYFHYLLRTRLYTSQFNCYSYGIMYERNRLYFDRFRVIPAPVPPLEEQEKIIKHILRETAQLEWVVAKAEREIALLREYRTRLIADVVTGKLDVRGVELPALDEVEAVGDWETDEDAQADEMDEMEGVDA